MEDTDTDSDNEFEKGSIPKEHPGNDSQKGTKIMEDHANNPQQNPSLPQAGQDSGPPPIAKFTEAYQEYGHMAPKGLDYEGSDIAAFDDDNDVVKEINKGSRESSLPSTFRRGKASRKKTL